MKVINLITLTVFLLLIGCNGFEDTSEDLSFDRELGAQLLEENEDVVSDAIEELMDDESNAIPTASEEFLESENQDDGIYTGAPVENGFLSETVPEELLSTEEEEGTELLSEGAYGGRKYRGNQPAWVPRGCYAIRNGVLRSKKKVHKYADHEKRVKEMAKSSTYTYTMAFKWWKRKMNTVWGGLFYRYSTANCNWRFCHRRPTLWLNRDTQKLYWQSVFTGKKIYGVASSNLIEEGRWMYVAVTIKRLTSKTYQLVINLNGVITSKVIKRYPLEVVGGAGRMYTGLHRSAAGGGLTGKVQIYNPGADIAKFSFCPYALTAKEVAVWRKRAASGLLEGMERFRSRKYVPYKYRRPYGPKKSYNPKTPYNPKKTYKPTPKKPYKPAPKKPVYKPTPKKPYKPTPKKSVYKPTPKKSEYKPKKPVYKPKKPSKPVYKPKEEVYKPRRRRRSYRVRRRGGEYGRRRRGKGKKVGYRRRRKYGRRLRKGKKGNRYKVRKGKYGRRIRRRRGKGYPRRGRKGKYGRRVRRRRGKGYPRREGKEKYGRRVRRRRSKGYPQRERRYGRRDRSYRARREDYDSRPVRKYDDYSDDLM